MTHHCKDCKFYEAFPGKPYGECNRLNYDTFPQRDYCESLPTISEMFWCSGIKLKVTIEKRIG